jgi:hypothetical protein
MSHGGESNPDYIDLMSDFHSPTLILAATLSAKTGIVRAEPQMILLMLTVVMKGSLLGPDLRADSVDVTYGWSGISWYWPILLLRAVSDSLSSIVRC